MCDWTGGDVGFDFNGGRVFFVIAHRPRLKAIDIRRYEAGKRPRFIGRYSDDLSVWEVKRMIMQMFPDLTDDEEVDE